MQRKSYKITSKEALSNILFIASVIGNRERINEFGNIIEKDLEVLEIIKDVFNYKSVQKFVDDMTKEQFFQVQE